MKQLNENCLHKAAEAEKLNYIELRRAKFEMEIAQLRFEAIEKFQKSKRVAERYREFLKTQYIDKIMCDLFDEHPFKVYPKTRGKYNELKCDYDINTDKILAEKYNPTDVHELTELEEEDET